MFELMRYTLLVVLGLTCLIILFIAIAVTSSILGQSGGLNPEQSHFTAYLIWGITAFCSCLWLSSSFILHTPKLIAAWWQRNKDHITAYAVVTMIFFVFVIV